MSEFLQRLKSGPALVLDGGLGSMLIARGLRGGDAPETWNAERPDDVTAVHRSYVEAGSTAVHANTFGGNIVRLKAYGLAERMTDLNGAAVRLARDAGASFVLGDVGPTGEYLAPVGKADGDVWRAAFAAQGRVLAQAAVDAIHVETMTDLREALLALEELQRAAPGVPVMVSMSFERRKRGFFTVMGNALAASLKALRDAGASAVGANCSITSTDMRDLAAEALAAVDVPLLLQPNAGQPERVDDKVVYRQDPEAFADDMGAVAALGVRGVGGCCGTDPRHIKALAARFAGRGAP